MDIGLVPQLTRLEGKALAAPGVGAFERPLPAVGRADVLLSVEGLEGRELGGMGVGDRRVMGWHSGFPLLAH